jgi:tRNA(fMet)-specific endonuclease VapC
LKRPPLYVLDTNVLVHLCRDDALGRHVKQAYDLQNQVYKPVICIVTHGEAQSFAELNNWGAPKRRKLAELLENLVTVDISNPEVLAAYAEIDVASQRHMEGSRNMGKNDLWIAAVTRVVNGRLLTTDKDFDHLHPQLIQREYLDLERFRGDRARHNAD